MSTARSGHDLDEIEEVIQDEIDSLKEEGPTQREVQRAINQNESAFLSGMESILGTANSLNDYYFRTGDPGYFHDDLARYRVVEPKDVQAQVREILKDDGRVVLSVVPEGQRNLAAGTPSDPGIATPSTGGAPGEPGERSPVPTTAPSSPGKEG